MPSLASCELHDSAFHLGRNLEQIGVYTPYADDLPSDLRRNGFLLTTDHLAR